MLSSQDTFAACIQHHNLSALICDVLNMQVSAIQQRAAQERWSLAGAALARALQSAPGAAASQAQPLLAPPVLAAGSLTAPRVSPPAGRAGGQAASAQGAVAAAAGHADAECAMMPLGRVRGVDAAIGTSAAAAGHADAERGCVQARHARDAAEPGNLHAAAEHADAHCGGADDAQIISPIQLSVATEPVAYAISVASAFSSPERHPSASTLAAYGEGGGISPARALPAASPEGYGGASASSPERMLPAHSLAAPRAGKDASPARDLPAARMQHAASGNGPEGDAGGQPGKRRPPSPAERRASWLAARAGGPRVDPSTLPAAGRPTGSGRRPGSASPGLRSSGGSKTLTPSASQGSTPMSAATRRAGASPSEGPVQGSGLRTMTPVRMVALHGGSAGRPPVSPAPAPPPEQGPAWLTALLAEAAKAAAGPAEAERAVSTGPEAGPGAGRPYARPERRRWELPDAGVICDALAIRDSAGRALEEACAAQGGSRAAGTGQVPVEAGGAVGVQGRIAEGECSGWAPLAEVVDVCVLAGVRAQYACSSRACLGCAPSTWARTSGHRHRDHEVTCQLEHALH